MAGKSSSPNFSTNDDAVKIKFRKPSSNSAREIRDAVLRDYFGYTDGDIKELDAQMPGKFFICPVSGAETEMSVEQVRNWTADPADGMLSMTLNDY